MKQMQEIDPYEPCLCGSGEKYTFLLRLLIVPYETFVPHRASVMSSTRRTDTPARYISIRASSIEDSLRR